MSLAVPIDYPVNGLGTQTFQKNLHCFFPLILSLEPNIAEKLAVRLMGRDLMHAMEVGYIIEQVLLDYSKAHTGNVPFIKPIPA